MLLFLVLMVAIGFLLRLGSPGYDHHIFWEAYPCFAYQSETTFLANPFGLQLEGAQASAGSWSG